MNKNKINILLIGQTPPPFGGQALSIKDVLDADFENISIHHVRMAFSKSLGETGEIGLKKFIHLISVLVRSIAYLSVNSTDLCYYPPSDGKKLFPFLRDVFLLWWLRSLFPKVKFLFVFHAAGLSIYLKEHAFLLKYFNSFVQKALFYPDGAIQFSEFNPPDASFLKAHKAEVIYGGLSDEYFEEPNKVQMSNIKTILFVGVLREEKGVTDLFNALQIVHQRRNDFQCICMGDFVNNDYKNFLCAFLNKNGLQDHVHFPGVLTGNSKWAIFKTSDFFCFPSFATFESFPRVVLEAMMFKLPVIGTKWRGIQGTIQDGITGFLIEPNDSNMLARKIEFLLQNPEEILKMGEAARQRYLDRYTKEIKLHKYENFFRSVCED